MNLFPDGTLCVSTAPEGAVSVGLVVEGATVTSRADHGKTPAEWAQADALLRDARLAWQDHHAQRAREASSEGRRSTAAWHDARATSLLRSFRSRRAECGTVRHVRAWCASCGTVHQMRCGCGLRAWCEPCADASARRMHKRVLPALAEAERRERSRWAKGTRRAADRPSVRLVTLTVRDTGDLRADRERISKGWQRLRAWLQRRVGARPFMLAWELTDGVHGGGHVHAHAVVVWPWVPVREAAAEWVRATGGAAEMQGFDMRPMSTTAAAKYAAKYAAKGTTPRALSLATWAAWIRVTRGARSYTTSRGLLALADVRSRPPCCASEGGEWGGAEVRRGVPSGENPHGTEKTSGLRDSG